MASEPPLNEFERASNQRPPSLVREVIQFVCENKKWWLIPIFLAFGLIGILAVLASSGAAPFIYTLF